MTSSQKINSNLIKLSEEYWENLDTVLKMTKEQTELCFQSIRNAILDIFAIGIPHKDKDNNTLYRHILSAKEISNELNERLEEDVKQSNVYFHLNKLEEANLVKVVTQIPVGKKYTSYYSRSSKVLLPYDEIEGDFTKLRNYKSHLIKLISRLNPEVPKNHIDNLIENSLLNRWSYKEEEKMGEWLKKMNKDLIELDFDMRVIADLLAALDHYADYMINQMVEIAKLLKYKI